MIKIIMHGCGGKMGRVIANIVSQRSDCEIAAGIDPTKPELEFPTFSSLEDCTVKADVIIDFSTAAAADGLMEYAANTGIPLVLCTTGLSDEQMEKLKLAGEKTAVLKSANMSVGVNLILKLLHQISPALYDAGFDIEIVEKHHNQKIDAPSGTALALADAINASLDNSAEYVYDRSKTREKRRHSEIGLHAVRGGTIVGEHDVIFAGRDEIIEINHKAMSKEIFAVGAVEAAVFLAGKPKGFYTMQDVMK